MMHIIIEKDTHNIYINIICIIEVSKHANPDFFLSLCNYSSPDFWNF